MALQAGAAVPCLGLTARERGAQAEFASPAWPKGKPDKHGPQVKEVWPSSQACLFSLAPHCALGNDSAVALMKLQSVETVLSTTAATLTACLRSAVVIIVEELTRTLIAAAAACARGSGATSTSDEAVVEAPSESATCTKTLMDAGLSRSGDARVASSRLLWLTSPSPYDEVALLAPPDKSEANDRDVKPKL